MDRAVAPRGDEVQLPAALRAFIADAYEDAIRRHGNLGLDFDAFLSGILSRARGGGELLSTVGLLNTADIYLAEACAAGHETGWLRFGALYGKFMTEIARRSLGDVEAARELADRVTVDLFMPDRTGRSRIGSFTGLSSMATWLRAVVLHRASHERGRRTRREQPMDRDIEVVDRSALAAIESSGDDRHVRAVEDSCKRALERLTPQERLLLIWRYDEGLLLNEIASLMRVHVSTVARQIDRLCQKIHAHVMRLLAQEYGLGAIAVHECVLDFIDNRDETASLLTLLRELNVRHTRDADGEGACRGAN